MEKGNGIMNDLVAKVERVGKSKDSAEMWELVVVSAGTATNGDAESCDQGIAMLHLLQEALDAADLPEDAKSYWGNTIEWQIDVCAMQRESFE